MTLSERYTLRTQGKTYICRALGYWAMPAVLVTRATSKEEAAMKFHTQLVAVNLGQLVTMAMITELDDTSAAVIVACDGEY